MSERETIQSGYNNEGIDNGKIEKQHRSLLRQKWFALGCLSSLIVFILFITMITVSVVLVSKPKAPYIAKGSYLYFKLSGNLIEYEEIHNDIMFFTDDSPSIRGLIDKVNFASTDKDIDGIILEPQYLATGLSSLNELIEALENFKQSGKNVYAYLENASNQDYYLASVADEIILNPSQSAGILLTGVGMSTLYMKELMDKLGVEMTVLHCGDYKGIGENYTHKTMSPEVKENYNHY